MQIPFNQVELSPLLYQIYVFVCPMCRCICIFEWDNCDEKKRHRIKDFLLCQFFAGAKYGRIVFLPDKTVIKQTKFVKFSLGRWMTLKRQEALAHS